MWFLLFFAAVGVALRCLLLVMNMNSVLLSSDMVTLLEELSLSLPLLDRDKDPGADMKFQQESFSSSSSFELLNIPATLLPQPIKHPKLPVFSVHCIGETFLNDTSPLFRSCQYTNLCFHAGHNESVLYLSEQHFRLQSVLLQGIHLSFVARPVLVAAVPHPLPPRHPAVGEMLRDATSPESMAIWH
jgi:hypothetical protein